ncbi:MAG: FKBP-type peptidyl-prolyl cis-trans isomerase [Mariprofundaceae bacterium]
MKFGITIGMCAALLLAFGQQISDAGEARVTKVEKAGAEFLAANKKKSGVIETASGLQYLIIRQGDGAKPKTTDVVRVHYQGNLIDGTKFDSSYDRGQPAEFPLNQVIRGWTEGLQLMSVGSKFRFFIPPDLAYGKRGAGRLIGPNATLVFDVELLGIGS